VSFAVAWGDHVARKVHELFGVERGSHGRPCEGDFVAGPLAAACLGFRDFDALPEAAGSSVRSLHIVDPAFGVVVFIGVLIGERTVEIADFAHDPDYWPTIARDPDE
jgi:hypothetical protein